MSKLKIEFISGNNTKLYISNTNKVKDNANNLNSLLVYVNTYYTPAFIMELIFLGFVLEIKSIEIKLF